MKRIVAAVIFISLTGIVLVGYFRFFAAATGFSGKEKIIYIKTKAATRSEILKVLEKDSVVKNINHFDWLAGKLDYWENIKPGRYKITAGMSVKQMVVYLRSGSQFPARLVINKLRLTEDLGKVMARAIEADSSEIMQFLKNGDSLKKYELNEANLLAHIIPDTYEVLWTWTPERTLKKLMEDRDKWWGKNNREDKARKLGLRPEEVHTLASIVEEETNKKEDKPKVASVYLNRIKLGMPLQADPTIRYALKNFKMNRVLYVHLRTPSPYNTYLNRGLPPGPICTASPSTIDAVLDAPDTDYIFFVANADLLGGSTFTTNLTDHNRAAKVYQDSLSAWLKRKAIREKTKLDSIAKAQPNSKK
jgi:UPF0755 protein